MYDTAGCLLANLGDEAIDQRFRKGMEDDALKRYAEKCGSGFGDGASEPGIAHTRLLDDVRQWPEWQKCAPGLIAFFPTT